MANGRFSGLFVNLGLGIALAGGLVYSSFVVTRSVERLRSTVEVKGYAEHKMKAESATWTINVKAHHAELGGAFVALEESKNEVLAFLKNAGIKEIDFGSVYKTSLYKDTRDQRNVDEDELSHVASYEVSLPIMVTTTDVEKIKELSVKISELGARGVDIEPRPPAYFLSREKFEKVKVELLAEATKSAKERADQFALNSDIKIGRLMTARQGVFQVTTENTRDVQDYGIYDTSTIDKVVKIVVTLAYTTGN